MTAMTGPQFSLILPCFNEASHFMISIASIVRVLEASSLRYEIILIDDASSDDTPNLIEIARRTYRSLHAFFHTKNEGRGKTVVEGILAARSPVVGYMDIDCEVSPVYIPKCVRLIIQGKADIVVGRRIYPIVLGSIFRAIYSKGYKFIANSVVGTAGIDTESGYKFFDRYKILPIISQTHHPHWFWDTEVMVVSKRAGLRIREIPVVFRRREDKKSTVRASVDIADYLISLWRFRKRLL